MTTQPVRRTTCDIGGHHDYNSQGQCFRCRALSPLRIERDELKAELEQMRAARVLPTEAER